MKKIFLCLLILIIPLSSYANVICNDGTVSLSCGTCHQGCCSHHGGCSNNYTSDYDEDDYVPHFKDSSENNSNAITLEEYRKLQKDSNKKSNYIDENDNNNEPSEEKKEYLFTSIALVIGSFINVSVQKNKSD